MNSKNTKTADPHRLVLNLADKIVVRRSALSNLSIYNTWKNIKGSYKNNKFKICKFGLPEVSYSATDI